MINNTGLKKPSASAGQSMIELALILPILLLLALGVVDFARAIQFNNILVSMSREGANLAARSTSDPQFIITALTTTAEPLKMATNGMVYITEIIGKKVDASCVDNPPGTCAAAAKVSAQYRMQSGGNRSMLSNVWVCSSWLSNGSCVLPNTPPAAVLPPGLTLRDGEMVYAVETYYDYDVLVNYVMQTDPKLYSETIL